MHRLVMYRAFGSTVFLVFVMASCVRQPAPPVAGRMAQEGPVITALVPDHGPAGEAYPIRLVIEGRGFSPEANTVQFGPVIVTDLPSEADGTRITLFVPKSIPSRGEVPPEVLLPGTYEVTVTTSEGTSPPVSFTLEAGS